MNGESSSGTKNESEGGNEDRKSEAGPDEGQCPLDKITDITRRAKETSQFHASSRCRFPFEHGNIWSSVRRTRSDSDE